MDLKTLKKLASQEHGGTGVGWLDGLYLIHKRPYYLFLYELTNLTKPSFIVEIGTQTGMSTAHMAAGSPDAHIIGIDPDPVWYEQEIKDSFPKVKFLSEKSQDVLIDEIEDGIDILFIDGLHTYDQVKWEYETYGEKVRPGGLIVLDDINLPDELEPGNGMREFWDEIKDPKIELNHLHPEGGFGIVIKK